MGRKRIYTNDAERQRARRAREGRSPRSFVNRPDRELARRLKAWRERAIVGIDGEGYDIAPGRHVLTLLAAGDGATTLHIENAHGLSTVSCLNFLFDVQGHFTRIHHHAPLFVIYAGSYDFTMMMKSLDESDLRSLYDNGVTYVYLGGHKYRIKVVQRKLLQITKYLTKETKLSITIYDVFGFFQSSFVRALIDWKVATEPELAAMATMKAARSDFASMNADDIRAYNESEIRYLVALVSKLREALDECKFYIASWHGAGAIAGYLMKQHGITNHIVQRWEEPIETAVKTAYFGGRVQLLKAGRFPEAHMHDVVSAYPSAHATLPSLAGCRVAKADGRQFSESRPWSVWRVSWRLPKGSSLQPFPLRVAGNIYYEQLGSGWYWYPEVLAAKKHLGNAITIYEGYVFDCDDTYPFNYIYDLFELRKQYKTAGSAAEKPLKLGYNSHYGKHAQHTERGATILPAYQCYWYAGYITSVCRARVFELAARNPQAIIAIATDGVFATEKLTHPNEEGTALGSWEYTHVKDMFIVQPGIYRYTALSGQEKTKTRGLMPKEVDWSALQTAFFRADRVAMNDEISVYTERFIGLKTAAARGKLEQMGQWERGERHIALTLHPTRALPSDRILHDATGDYITYYGRLSDLGDSSGRSPSVPQSEPFLGRYDPANVTEYVAELGEIDDNAELWGEL